MSSGGASGTNFQGTGGAARDDAAYHGALSSEARLGLESPETGNKAGRGNQQDQQASKEVNIGAATTGTAAASSSINIVGGTHLQQGSMSTPPTTGSAGQSAVFYLDRLLKEVVAAQLVLETEALLLDDEIEEHRLFWRLRSVLLGIIQSNTVSVVSRRKLRSIGAGQGVYDEGGLLTPANLVFRNSQTVDFHALRSGSGGTEQ
eukprot:GSA25T00000624001.1